MNLCEMYILHLRFSAVQVGIILITELEGWGWGCFCSSIWSVAGMDAKCRHIKNWPVKGICGRCLSVLGPLPSYDPIHNVYVFTVYLYTQGRENWTREKVKGASVHKAGSKIQHDWLYLQSMNSDKHLPQSPCTRQIFLDDDILFCCLYS